MSCEDIALWGHFGVRRLAAAFSKLARPWRGEVLDSRFRGNDKGMPFAVTSAQAGVQDPFLEGQLQKAVFTKRTHYVLENIDSFNFATQENPRDPRIFRHALP